MGMEGIDNHLVSFNVLWLSSALSSDTEAGLALFCGRSTFSDTDLTVIYSA